MSNNYGITVDNLLRTLPDVLKNDKNMWALAQVVAAELASRPSEIDNIRIYTRIDDLPEELLDILAYDFKIDWWDPNFTLAEKRQIFKDNKKVKRKLGTPYAVETALSAIYPGTVMKEWFEYGGQPHHFKLVIPVDQQSVDPEKHAKVLSLTKYYKRRSSKLDEVEYFGSSGTAVAYAAAAAVGCATVVTATAHNY